MGFLKWLKENSKWVLNQKGTWAGISVGVGAGGLGYSIFKGETAGGERELQTFMPKVEFLDQPDPKFFPGPKPEQFAEFPEAEAARKTWWGKLQEFGGQPGYGAIAPDWGDIWQRAQKKVKQYYWGGPGGEPGVAGKVRASAARRGVSESPALETEISRMGMREAGQISDLATEQAIQEAQFGEMGRQNWLQQLGLITQLRPQYYQPAGLWQSPYAVQEQAFFGGGGAGGPTTGQLAGELGTAAFDVAGQITQRNWLEKMFAGQTTTDLTIPDAPQYDYSLGSADIYG